MARHSAPSVPDASNERVAVVQRPRAEVPRARRSASAPLRLAPGRAVATGPVVRRRRHVLPLLGFCASFAFVSASLVNPLAGAQAATATTGGAAALVAPGQSFTVDSAVAATTASRDAYEITQYVPPAPVVTETPEPGATEAPDGAADAPAAPAAPKSSGAPAAGTPDPGSAKAAAAELIAARGWGTGEYDCLVALWQKESGWNTYAYNPSGAYGIPQALPGSKMASAGADWQTNPATQITWGLGYISGRYGTPCGAWGHSQSHNWY
ncbi:aggregation-promoting factor C-terminal-like domain-containing protein [Frigoribacterium salinisoli]